MRLKILLCSHAFAPNIGGIETMSAILAQEFCRSGHEVKVVTQTPDNSNQPFPYPVLRNPERKDLLNALRWSDVVLHNNISLQTAWPLAIVRRPWVVIHQTWIRREDGTLGRNEKLKRFALKFSHQVAISKAIAADVKGCNAIVGNCYDSNLFRVLPDIERNEDLIFVGRLVSDKGADLAIQAISELKKRGKFVRLTIVGGGEEESNLKCLVEETGVGDLVKFTGPKTGFDLVEEMNRHKVMVVPSRWNEPFGIVALEGIACGCVVIGSNGGGMPDAIGPCGVTFSNNDLNDLTEQIERLVELPEIRESQRARAEEHLAKFTPEFIAGEYLKILEGARK